MKQLLFILLTVILSITFATAQTEKKVESLESKVTMGMFKGLSDTINSSDIFNFSDSFVVAGYDKAAFVASGIKINPELNIGAIAKIEFADSADNESTTYGSDYDITLAVGYKNMGFSYRLFKEGTDIFTETYNYEKEDWNSYWQHTLEYSTIFSNDMKMTIPVVVEHDLRREKIKSIISQINTEELIGNGGDVTIGLFPSLDIPLEKGILESIEFNTGIKFAVYNTVNIYQYSSNLSPTVVKDSNTEYLDTYITIGITPNLKWSLEDTISFTAKPSFSCPIGIKSDGQEQPTFTDGVQGPDIPSNNTTTTSITPTFYLPIAFIYSPIDWFDLRVGALGTLAWEFINAVKEPDSSMFSYINKSSFELGVGFGFKLTQDFLIDFAFTEKLNTLNIESLSEIFTQEISLQFTYKF